MPLREYLDFIKFSHTIFALPFALAALALAGHRLPAWRWLDAVGVLACMVLARSAAMGFNRWADRRFDARNPRTQGRSLPAGRLTERQALAFVAACSVGFVASTALFLASSGNWWPLAWSVPLLLFIFGYSYAKRFSAGAHLWLGMALAGAPVGVWIALRPPGDWWPPGLWACAIAAWVAGFDIIYACQDIAVDRELGLRSVPAALGFRGALRVAAGLHLGAVVFLALLPTMTPELRVWFPWAVGAVALLLAVEHGLARKQDLARINFAFFQMNAIISVLLLAATLLDLRGK